MFQTTSMRPTYSAYIQPAHHVHDRSAACSYGVCALRRRRSGCGFRFVTCTRWYGQHSASARWRDTAISVTHGQDRPLQTPPLVHSGHSIAPSRVPLAPRASTLRFPSILLSLSLRLCDDADADAFPHGPPIIHSCASLPPFVAHPFHRALPTRLHGTCSALYADSTFAHLSAHRTASYLRSSPLSPTFLAYAPPFCRGFQAR